MDGVSDGPKLKEDLVRGLRRAEALFTEIKGSCY